jgi:hypothetical protein
MYFNIHPNRLSDGILYLIYLFIRALLTLIVSHPMLPSWRGYLVETHPPVLRGFLHSTPCVCPSLTNSLTGPYLDGGATE